jgi:preprotein translocase subunit YajC
MKFNWLILLLVLIAIMAFLVFFIRRNHKDKKDLMQDLIKNDEASMPKEHDSEIDPT